MNFELIGHLIRLRYKLLWAKTRSRNGKIALFMVGYLLFVLVALVLAMGGLGAGLAAVRSGKAEKLAQGVLTGLYATAAITSVVLGFGLNAIFSDTELRRYPLRVQERFVARHFTGIVDPFWFLFLALYLGLAVGLYAWGAGSFGLGLVAVLVLFVSNYLLAQVLAVLLDRIMRKKSGSFLLPLVIFGFCMTPALLAPKLEKNPAALRGVARILRFTPPFGAGTLMTRTDLAALYGFGLMVAWTGLLVTVLLFLEKRPARTRVAPASTLIRWDSPYERAGALFSPRYAPLVAQWLRFYLRCGRFRIAYLLSVPLVPVLLFAFARQAHGSEFASGLGIFAVAGFAPTAAFCVNQFGYTGDGFRRYFLIPIDPAATLRASSYCLMLLSSLLIPVAIAGWLLFAPVRSDGRMLFMLVGSAVTGMFAFHGIGLWTTLFGPRRSNYYSTMGNDLSLAGNVVVIGGIMACLFVPRFLASQIRPVTSPDNWWELFPAMLLAAAFYFGSLRQATAILKSRREKLLGIVEGRS